MNLSVLKDLKYGKKYLKNCIISVNAYPALYIVLSGEVGEFAGYRKQNQKLENKYGTGDYFGESALFFNVKSKSEFVALTDVVAIVVSRTQATDFIREEPGVAFELMKEFYKKQTSPAAVTETPAPPPEPEVKAPEVKAPEAKPAQAAAAPKAEPYAGPIVPAHTADPSPEAQASAAKPPAALFPEGHKTYQLQMNNQDREHLLQKKCTCPLCHKEFSILHVREAKLVHLETDRDMRTHYKDIEPLYYNVVTCPACHYSALEDMFGHPDKPGHAKLPDRFDALVPPEYKFGCELDADSVFAGYYLALLCAPHCFNRYQMAEAKIYYRLQQIYKDAGDEEMERITAQKALDAYSYVYLNMDVPPNQDQQLCVLLGELTLKLGDSKAAKDYFFKAKTNKQGTPMLQRHADDRIYDIKEAEPKAEK